MTSINGTSIPVTSTTLSEEAALWATNSRIMREWINSLDSQFVIEAIEIQIVDFKGPPSINNILFIRLKVIESGLAKIVELRGNTVAILVVLQCENKDYTVLVKQPRLATGYYDLLEIPAGMLDEGIFKGKAADELQEEIGITITHDDLIDLTPVDTIYLSPGLLDEACKFYLVQLSMTREELNNLQGKHTGLVHEGELITLEIVDLPTLPKVTRDAKALIAYLLYTLKLQQD